MLKRIYAVVSDKDFYGVRDHAQKEDLTLGEALAALAHMYASGELTSIKHHKDAVQKAHSTQRGAVYKPTLKEVQGDE